MTTADVETKADIGQVSDPSLNVPSLLRDEVIPEFLHDVGYVSWRRRTATITTSAGTKVYALPTDFDIAQSVMNGITEIKYIGEDPVQMNTAKVNVTQAAPVGYFLEYDPSGSINPQNQLSFQAPCNGTLTIALTYYSIPVFADYTTPVDLGKFCPVPYQGGILWGLRARIAYFRFGIGDPRYIAAEKKYADYVERCQENKERARRNLPVFVK